MKTRITSLLLSTFLTAATVSASPQAIGVPGPVVMPTPIPESACKAKLECCEQIIESNSPVFGPILPILSANGVILPSGNIPIGIECSPLLIPGTCTLTPACCDEICCSSPTPISPIMPNINIGLNCTPVIIGSQSPCDDAMIELLSSIFRNI